MIRCKNSRPKTAVSVRRSVPRSPARDVIGLAEPLPRQAPALCEAGRSSGGDKLNNQWVSSPSGFGERPALVGNSCVGVHNDADSPFLPVHTENGEPSEPLIDNPIIDAAVIPRRAAMPNLAQNESRLIFGVNVVT